jgi:FdhD protein
MMRLPGDDRHLVAGICHSEGIVDSAADIASMGPAGEKDPIPAWDVALAPDMAARFLQVRAARAAAADAAAAVLDGSEPFFDPRPRATRTPLPLDALLRMKGVFEGRKDIHPQTGATHSASLFDRDLGLLAYAEDIGRHNALDKAVGAVLLAGRKADAFLCIMSSRQSHELVAKAGRLGVEVLVGVSTVTSLAVDLADRLGITLIGFFRKNRMNIYTHPERIVG